MDELERVLRGWRADLCTCKSVSDSQHWVGCAAGRISDDDLDVLYMELDEWHDDLVEYEVGAAMTTVVDDPE